MTTPVNVTGWNTTGLQEISDNEDGRPILFTNARILSLDPLLGTIVGDVLLGGDLIVGVGPGIVTAAADDNAIVVDATGTTIVPAVVDGLALVGARSQRIDNVATLTPGNIADLLVVPDEYAPDAPTALATLLTDPQRVRALLAGGALVLWDGQDVPGRPVAPVAGVPAAQDLTGSPRVGVWVDRTDFLHQALTADGRYDETRGGRPHAYQGRYWVDRDRIDYLDDLGFWASASSSGTSCTTPAT